MSMLLFIIGGIAVMVGAATVAFGIPINEFSFGNTLIVSGTTIGAGGLIVIAIAAAVGQLTRIAEALAARPAALPHEGLEPPPEAAGAPAPGRIPFPSRTRPAEPALREPPAFEPPVGAEPAAAEEHAEESFAPALRNPEAPPLTVEEEVSLSPQPSSSSAPAEFAEPRRPAPPHEPVYEPPNFDAMWPAKPEQPPVSAAPEPAPPAPPPSPPRAVAILKSGVIDGMGYTLYVDGSIEAELPQGTLHFASIDELRAHLEKGS
jgi:hypothetical protein